MQDGSVIEPACKVKVDEYGFFIYWSSEGKVSDMTGTTEVRRNSLGRCVRLTWAGCLTHLGRGV